VAASAHVTPRFLFATASVPIPRRRPEAEPFGLLGAVARMAKAMVRRKPATPPASLPVAGR